MMINMQLFLQHLSPRRLAGRLGVALLCMACFPGGSTAAQTTVVPPAQRIVSLSPALTKQLYLLGLTSNVVGITTYCPQPAGDLPAIEIVGTVVDPSTERILRLKPDLMVCTPLANRKRIATLREAGIRILEFRAAQSCKEVSEQFLELGNATGAADQADTIVRDVDATVSAIRRTVAGVDRPGVFIQIGAKPLCTAGRDSFLNDLVEMAGGTNIADDTTYRIYSREAVLAANPDCILIVTMGLTGVEEKQQWSQYKNLAAAVNQRIYMIDAEQVCSPTPIDFTNILNTVIGLLHPEAAAAVTP